MVHLRSAVLLWAYLLGLFGAALLPDSVSVGFPVAITPVIFFVGWLGIGGIAALLMPRVWPLGPRAPVWLIAGAIAFLASYYFQWRSPQPGPQDISRWVEILAQQPGRPIVQVTGKIQQQPILNRADKVRFVLRANQVAVTRSPSTAQPQTATGKLYVTVPLLQGTGLYPGQRLTVQGRLYEPQSATNPGSFDFKRYLNRQGIYAGLAGSDIVSDRPQKLPWGWWQLRRRILQAQVQRLGMPEGALVSAMVMGRRVVDLPYDIQDQFIQTGLAHVFSASGFHVSLLLGAILTTTRRFSQRSQLSFGTASLLLYLGLTGLQPSVARAALMGAVALLALVLDRKIRRLGLLLTVAVGLLIANPLWITDLGFQLSFLSTLGILITLPALQQRILWLPEAIAGWVLVPVAASLWTLPLVMFQFQQVTPYNIPANIITAPLVLLLSLGGMISAMVTVVWPWAGSGLAWLLLYPAQLLLAIVQGFNRLPGSTWAVGQLPVAILLLLYGLLILVWQSQWWQRHWYLVGLGAIALFSAQSGLGYYTREQVTVLATNSDPVVVVQQHGRVTLINTGDGDAVNYTVLPFLRSQGVNQLDCALTFAQQGPLWSTISSQVVIAEHLSPGLGDWASEQPMDCGAATFTWWMSQPKVLEFEVGDQVWRLIGGAGDEPVAGLPQAEGRSVLVGSTEALSPSIVESLQPNVVITVGREEESGTKQQFVTGQDGALQWCSDQGFQTHITSESLYTGRGVTLD